MRKLVVGVLAVGLVMTGVLVALLGPWPCRVTRANCERIKPGMTRAEVEKVLGGPPGEYQTRPSSRSKVVFPWGSCSRWLVEEWEGDEGTVTVEYDPGPSGHEVVGFATFDAAKPPNPGPVAVATWRLKRLKERWLP